MNVQDAQQAAAWARQRQYIVQTIAGMSQLQQAGTQAGAKTQAAFQGLGGTVTNVAGGLKGITGTLFGITTAVQLFKREIDGIKMRNENALESQLNVAAAQRSALSALGTGANISQKDLIRRIESQSFVLPATAYSVAESAISGSGNLGARRAIDTTIAAGEFAPHLDVGSLRSIASGALELQKSYPEYNARQAVAQVFQAMAIDRSEDPGQFAKNVIPGIANARAFGGGKDSFGFMASFFSAIGQRAGDPYGAVTRTAGINFMEQILTEGVASGLFKKGTSVEGQLQAVRGSDPRAVAIRNKLLGALSDDRTAAEAASKKDPSDGQLHTRAATMIAMSEMLQPGSQTAKMVEEFKRRSAGSPSQVLARQEEFMRGVNTLPGQQSFAAQRAVDVGIAGLRTDPNRGLRGVRAELVKGLYEAGGRFKVYSDAERFFDSVESEVEDLAPSQQFRSMAAKIRGTREYLEGPKTVIESSGTPDLYGYGVSQAATTRPPTASEVESAKSLARMEKMMERQAELLERQIQIMEADGPRSAPSPRSSPAGRLNDR